MIGELFPMLATATGWTYEQVGGHTLHEVMELMGRWEHDPPAQVLLRRLNGIVGALAGVKSQSKPIVPSDGELIATAEAINAGTR